MVAEGGTLRRVTESLRMSRIMSRKGGATRRVFGCAAKALREGRFFNMDIKESAHFWE